MRGSYYNTPKDIFYLLRGGLEGLGLRRNALGSGCRVWGLGPWAPDLRQEFLKVDQLLVFDKGF